MAPPPRAVRSGPSGQAWRAAPEPEPGEAWAIRAGAAAQVFVEDPAAPVLSEEDRHHLGRVLRLRSGETVVASDGQGGWTLCTVGAGSRGDWGDGTLEVAGPLWCAPAPSPPLAVLLAPPKGDRLEWAVQKLTEAGMDRIGILEADRAVVRWDPARRERVLERLGRVAKEAAAQSRRVWVPELFAAGTLARALGDPRAQAKEAGEAGGSQEGWAMAERGGGGWPAGTTCVVVGPEGGWSPRELALGLPRVSLASAVLRAETAAVAAGVLLEATRARIVAGGPRPGGGAREDPARTARVGECPR